MRKFFFGLLPLYLVACDRSPCSDDLEISSIEGKLLFEDEVIYELSAQACPENIDSTTADNIWAQAYFTPMASDAGISVEKAFELGREQIEPVEIVATDNNFEGSFIEVRNLKTLANNINRENFDFSYKKVNREIEIEATTDLTGHPLLLYLSLAGPRDKGGAKNWKVDRITKDEAGTDAVDVENWQCILDNEYAFQKGNRVRYDANGPEDEGTFCQKELDYLEGDNDLEFIYGNYQVVQTENDGIAIDIFLADPNNSDENLLEYHFPVVSYDWFSLTLQVENESEEKAYVHLVSTGTLTEI